MTTRPLCSDGEFPHEERCCVGCPKGQYVLSSCEKLKQTVCQECPHGHYTDDVNFLFKCRPCRSCHSSSHMMLAGECKANQNRQCICEDGFYCVESSCEHCRPVSKDMECPQGHGVTTSSKGQMACTKCPEGTYNNVTDSKTPCLPHTNCKAPGMQLKDPGTEYSDALCEPVKIRAEPGCHWVLPACLWAGLALTVLFIGFGYFCWGTKRRSKKKKVHKLELERNDVTLNFPNPIPASYQELCKDEQHTLCNNGKLCDDHFPSAVMPSSFPVEVDHSMKSVDLECDGPQMPTLTASERFGQSAARREERQNFTASLGQSQPQEDEWSET